MARSAVLIAKLGSLLITGAVIAQPPLKPQRPFVPVSEVLEKKGYTTPADVVRALWDPNPDIRGVAAFRLAEEHDPQAVQLINKALSAENDDTVKVNYASALWSLGVATGQTQLESLCIAAGSSKVLASATIQLVLRGKGGVCIENLIAAYSHAENSADSRNWASLLRLASDDPDLPATTRLIALAQEALAGSELEVQLVGINSRELRGTLAAKQAPQDAPGAETGQMLKLRLRQAISHLSLQAH